MELRHLRYFVAVARARSLKLAAKQTLHTTQPSLSRQIRDLEDELGTSLFSRSTRGVELTPAGHVFLDHAHAMLAQAETAVASVRPSASKPSLSLGFMMGHDTSWAPAAVQLLREELPNIHLRISTQSSAQLAMAVSGGLLDIAFLHRHDADDGLALRHLADEPIEVFLRADHALAAHDAIRLEQIKDYTFLAATGAALDRYLEASGVELTPSHEVDNLGSMMSLIASTDGIALLPAGAKRGLPSTVIARPLSGRAPTIDLSVGYRKANASPIVKAFLSRLGTLAAKVNG